MSVRAKSCFRLFFVMCGFFLIANGIILMVQSQLGANPWDVLHLGISYQTGLSLGRVIQYTGILVVAASSLFHIRPRLGTLLNMIFIGLFVDVVQNLAYIPQPGAAWLKVAFYITGVCFIGFGTAFYISSNLGAGPRDSLMLVLAKLTSRRAGLVRTVIEIIVATLGYLFGGPLGLGTLLFVLFVGFFMEAGFSIIGWFKKSRLFSLWWHGTPPALAEREA